MQCQHRKYDFSALQPRLSDGLTGLGCDEQQAGALRGEQKHEEGMEPGVALDMVMEYDLA